MVIPRAANDDCIKRRPVDGSVVPVDDAMFDAGCAKGATQDLQILVAPSSRLNGDETED